MRLEDITLDKLVEVLNSKPLGLLLILPNVAQKDIGSKLEKMWVEIQETLATHRLNIPIYFTQEDSDKIELYNELRQEKEKKQKGIDDEGMFFKTTPYMEVKGSDPTLIPSLELSVLYGVMKSDEELKSSHKPLVLITASYDFLSISPGMSKGVNAASGMMAIYDLSRIFAQVLEDPRLKDSAQYDFMFILTPGSSMDYEISGQFIESLNPRLKENIKFILSLDSIAYANDLTLHFGNVNSKESKFAKETLVLMRETVSGFEKDLKFNKKPSAGNFYEWEHIRYSDKGFFAGTLTSNPTEAFENKYAKFSVFDTEQNFDAAAYQENLKIVSEFLFKLIFPDFKDKESFFSSDESLVDTSINTQLIKFLSKNPRTPSELTEGSKVTQELHRLMKFHIKNTKVRRIRVNNPRFYQDTPVIHKMKYYRSESQLIDLVILACIMIYLGLIYLVTSQKQSKVKED